MKVMLCAPQSGKSCLREGLKQAIRQIKGAPYAFSACPDGEGAWFAETARRNLQQARQYIEAEVPMLRSSVHYLERGEDVSTRLIVRSLARVLVDLSRG